MLKGGVSILVFLELALRLALELFAFLNEVGVSILVFLELALRPQYLVGSQSV